jgi:hypothetical protein
MTAHHSACDSLAISRRLDGKCRVTWQSGCSAIVPYHIVRPGRCIDESWRIRYISGLATAMVGSSRGFSHLVDCHHRMERLSDRVYSAGSLVRFLIAFCIELSH